MGIGQKSLRTTARELNQRFRYTPEHIARILKEAHGRDVEPDQVREWIYPDRAAMRRRKSGTSSGISPASPAQRAKVRGRACIISGERPCDPSHLWPRSLGGCDDPLCVVPMAREPHNLYEEGKVDTLPALIAGGYVAEIQHVVWHADGSLLRALQQLTGQRYVPATADVAGLLDLILVEIQGVENPFPVWQKIEKLAKRIRGTDA